MIVIMSELQFNGIMLSVSGPVHAVRLFLSFQILRLIGFSIAGFNSFLSSYMSTWSLFFY